MAVVKCKLCGNNMEPAFEAMGYRLYGCEMCGFHQIDMSGTDTEEIYGASYFENSKYRDATALAKEHERRTILLSKYVSKNKIVLDYGCASGEFVKYAENDFDIYGCDYSADAIKIAKLRFPEINDQFFTLDDINTKKFDAICLWDVIEHVEEPDILMRNIRRLLNKDGFLLLSSPDIGSFFARIAKARWPFMTPPEHLCFYSRNSMQYLAQKYHFELIEWFAKGKWANVGFILYKFNRVSSVKIPEYIISKFKKGILSSLRMYVPTHDIQYVVLKKVEAEND